MTKIQSFQGNDKSFITLEKLSDNAVIINLTRTFDNKLLNQFRITKEQITEILQQ